MNKNKILIVDDEPAIRAALRESFVKAGWMPEGVSGVTEAIRRFTSEHFDIVVTDIRMPDGSGLDLMRELRRIRPDLPVILLTAYGSIPDAVGAMKDGACDYLVKPVMFDQILAVAARLSRAHEPQSPAIKGSSRVLTKTLHDARQAAKTDADVLIEAESGTGKELLARLIHEESPRRTHPFVAVNCAAIPANLLESEMFGHVRGAFTGASASKIGKFEQAHGGTLLLDEIGEMPLELQPKLLRAVQEREVERVGDTQLRKVDVRIVATTNRPLREMVEEKRFRLDLYYRLNIVPLTIPPLRQRREDIAELGYYFLTKYAQAGSGSLTLSPAFLAGLERYSWPGNVRELENFIRRVIVLYPDARLGEEHLDPAMLPKVEEKIPCSGLQPGASLRDVERTLLQMTLDATDGNRTRAAEMLGISLRTVRNKIRDYGLPRRSFA